jgi:hypothetical protein
VPRGDVVVIEPDRGVVAAADQDRRLGEVGALALVGAVDDQDVGRAPNMSDRTTETADSTKIQRIAR